MGRVWFEKRNIQKILPTTDNCTTAQPKQTVRTHCQNNSTGTAVSLQQRDLLSSIWRSFKDTGWSKTAEVCDYQFKENKTFMILRGEPIQIS